MKVFISGASGLIGSNTLQYFRQQDIATVGSYFTFATPDTVYFNTLNLEEKSNFVIDEYAPDVIVHCGALTHVDYCESHAEESYLKTVVSTDNLLELARRYNAKVVYISTDYVFDGKQGPYHENDIVNPLSIYAQHKLEAEVKVLQDSNEHLVLRVTNVYGNELRNKNFVARIIEQCTQNKTLNLVLPIDQYATPVCAADVAKAMFLLLQNKSHGIYHIASTDYMNRVELALNVLKFFPNVKYTLETKTTEQLNQAAKRPLYGGLQKAKFNREFPTFVFETIDSYVSNLLVGTK